MRFALIGNPGVGKSLIFTQLTGIGVEVSNYPGTTVELKSGATCFQRERVELVDLPGIYSLDGTSEEETLVRRTLTDGSIGGAIVVMSAPRLERNLYLLLQVAESGIPLVAVVNMMDEAEAAGLAIDVARLRDQLGIEVLPTAAIHGRNVQEIIPLALSTARPSSLRVPYDADIEAAVRSLEKTLGASRRDSLWSLDGVGEDANLRESAAPLGREIEESHRMSVHEIMAANRFTLARELAAAAIRPGPPPKGFDLDRVLTHLRFGVPVMVLVLVGTLLTVFVVGTFLEERVVAFLGTWLVEPVRALPLPPLLASIAVSAAIAIQAGFGIAFPFILTFALLLAVLEDSGYMTRAAFLADKAMHGLGMHGGAIVPMVLAFGCNVPALMAVRNLGTRRERTIASVLITMVPCSARTVIIAGIVAAFVGILAAFSVYGIVLGLLILTGAVLSRRMPGKRFGMILEMAPLRRPDPGLVLRKAWLRVKEFLVIAMPLLLAGSVVLGLLEYSGVLARVQEFVAPVVQGVLGLPPYAVTALLFGILRKEMAFETLAVLSGTAQLDTVMTSAQLYIFAVVAVLFVPCVSTIAVLGREMGWRFAAAVSAYTVILGLLVAVMLNAIL